MSTFLKFTLPALFAAAGLAVAICLATGNGELLGDTAPVAVSHAQLQHPLSTFPAVFPTALNSAVGENNAEESSAPTAPIDTTAPPASQLPSLQATKTAHAQSPRPSAVASDASRAPIYVAQGPGGVDLPTVDQIPNLDKLRNPFLDDVNLPQDAGSPEMKAAIQGLQSLMPKSTPTPLPAVANPESAASEPDLAAGSQGNSAGDQGNTSSPPGPRSQTVIQRVPGEGDDRLSLTIPGEDINKVLQMLSVQGDLNILASKNVQGTVSASLKNVKIETALDAILKSTGFVWWQDGRFIHVGLPQDKIAMQQASDKIGTRLYRPNYVKASDLQLLITPILTPTIGTISVTSPSQVGIAPDGNTAGGDGFAGQDALLVRDYEIVLAEIDQIVQQVDLRPTQVAIEAMILSVNLDDKDELGVNFEILRDKSNIRIASGNPLGSLAQMDFSNGGLKVGFLDSSLAMFLNALESIGDTNVIATPRLMCLNKHRAEILIGEQLGYVSTTQTETSTTQSVEFLEVGTQLRIRPFISSDGMVRMEVHPELSTGNVRLVGNFTLPDKRVTQVTTNIMVQDGCTVIIGGLLRDEMSSTATQIPLFGSLPVIGPVFRQNSETLGRQEILVLITPRIIYEPDSCCRGDLAAGEFHHRQAVYADQMIPFSRRYLGRKYFRLSQMAWDAGNARQALRLANLAITFDPINRAAIDLRADIWSGTPIDDHTLPPERGGPAFDEELIPAWLMQRLDPGMSEVNHPLDPGRPGNEIDIVKPELGPGPLPELPRAEEPRPMAEARSGIPLQPTGPVPMARTALPRQ
jgi:type IV pilus assembly protein PilQ